MGKGDFSDEFERDKVRQITERGYPVAEVSQRLGVSQHSLYVRKKLFGKPVGAGEAEQATKVRRLKRELAGVFVHPIDQTRPGELLKQLPDYAFKMS